MLWEATEFQVWAAWKWKDLFPADLRLVWETFNRDAVQIAVGPTTGSTGHSLVCNRVVAGNLSAWESGYRKHNAANTPAPLSFLKILF